MHGYANILGLAGVAGCHAGYHSIFVHRGLGPPLGSSAHVPRGTSSQRHLGPAICRCSSLCHRLTLSCLGWCSWFVGSPAPVPRGGGVLMFLKGVFFFLAAPHPPRSSGLKDKGVRALRFMRPYCSWCEP